MQRIPIWWRWYFWACPVAWTIYGLVASQFGETETLVTDAHQTVKDFIRSYFGYKHDFVGPAAAVLVAFPALFALVFALGIKFLNFQRR